MAIEGEFLIAGLSFGNVLRTDLYFLSTLGFLRSGVNHEVLSLTLLCHHARRRLDGSDASTERSC